MWYRDVALVALVSARRPALPISTIRPSIGSNVLSYGAPLLEELGGTLRKGLVSAYRSKNGLEFLQSDVDLNKGNSGGPLLDESGNVVGVAVMGVLIDGQVSQGLNFFIPIERALASFDILIQHPSIPQS